MLSSLRKPLGDLPTGDLDDDDADLPTRSRRLHKRNKSPEPEPMLGSAFRAAALRNLPSRRLPEVQERAKLSKSEFIAGEAEESDEDADFGFGPKGTKDDDEEEDDDGQDKFLEELVDDKEMDLETLAEDKVREKDQ